MSIIIVVSILWLSQNTVFKAGIEIIWTPAQNAVILSYYK